MPETVLVRHPAWITHRKPRGRTVWDSQIRHETGVTLRARDPRDFKKILDIPPGHTFKKGRKLYADGAGFWELMLTRSGEPIPARHFEAYLRCDEVGDPLDVAFGHYLAGTPIGSNAGGGKWIGDCWTPACSRGRVMDPDRLGEVFADGREAASASLRRFLDDNVALVEHGVALRCRPVARSSGHHVGEGRLWHLATRRHIHTWSEIAIGPWIPRPADRNRQGPNPEQAEAMRRWREASLAIPDPNADLAYLLAAHAGPVRWALYDRLQKGGLQEEEAARFEAALDEFTPIARAATMGLAGAHDLAGELASFARAVECAALCPNRSADGSIPAELAGFVRGHVRPRVEAMLDAATPHDDLEALDGLAP